MGKVKSGTLPIVPVKNTTQNVLQVAAGIPSTSTPAVNSTFLTAHIMSLEIQRFIRHQAKLLGSPYVPPPVLSDSEWIDPTRNSGPPLPTTMWSSESVYVCICVCVCVYTTWSSATVRVCMCVCVYMRMRVYIYICVTVHEKGHAFVMRRFKVQGASVRQFTHLLNPQFPYLLHLLHLRCHKQDTPHCKPARYLGHAPSLSAPTGSSRGESSSEGQRGRVQ